MHNWLMIKKKEQEDRYSTSRFAIEAKSTVVTVPRQLTTATKHAEGAEPVPGVRSRWAMFLSLVCKAIELLITILLTSLGVTFLQSLASTIHSPAWLHSLIVPHCTIIAANYVPFTLVGASHDALPFNYALKQCGAQILPQLTGKSGISPNIFLQGSDFAIDGDMQSSQCWEFEGTSGQLGFSLTAMLNVSWISVDYDHAEGSLTAPHSMIVWGLVEDGDITNQPEIQNEAQQSLHQRLPSGAVHPFPESKRFVPLAILDYDPHLAARQQLFSVFREVQSLASPVGIVVLQILSNWGGRSTRLCQIGVYGLPVNT